MIVRFKDFTPRLGKEIYLAPTAVIIGNVVIGQQSSIWFGACLRGDYGPIWIGDRCSIQDNVVVHVNHTPNGKVFPTKVGSDCVIGHGAVIEGCEIGDGCLIGMNAVALPGARIGSGSIVAAGAVIREGQDVPENTLVAGAPAVVKRTFETPASGVGWAAQEYVQLRQTYLYNSAILTETEDA